MTFEAAMASAIATLTTSTTALLTAVGVVQTTLNNAIANFTAVINRVNNGLNLVDNTKDADKPVSTPTLAALLLKQAKLEDGVNIARVNGRSLLVGGDIVIARSATSLNFIAYADRNTLRATVSQVDDNTAVEGLGRFRWINTQLEPDDDELCFNTPAVSTMVSGVLTVTTPAGQWLLQTAAPDLLAAWNLLEQSITDDWREDEPIRFAAYLTSTK